MAGEDHHDCLLGFRLAAHRRGEILLKHHAITDKLGAGHDGRSACGAAEQRNRGEEAVG